MSYLGNIDIQQDDRNVTIAAGTVILTYTPYQARTIAAEIVAAATQAEKAATKWAGHEQR